MERTASVHILNAYKIAPLQRSPHRGCVAVPRAPGFPLGVEQTVHGLHVGSATGNVPVKKGCQLENAFCTVPKQSPLSKREKACDREMAVSHVMPPRRHCDMADENCCRVAACDKLTL